MKQIQLEGHKPLDFTSISQEMIISGMICVTLHFSICKFLSQHFLFHEYSTPKVKLKLMLLSWFSFINGRLAIDTHAHDLSAKTLRKTPSHGSLEMSPARSPPTVATMSTPMAPVLVPSMATAPIVAAPMGSAPLRLATVLPMTPMNGGQPAGSFPKEVMSPSNVPKVGGKLGNQLLFFFGI